MGEIVVVSVLITLRNSESLHNEHSSPAGVLCLRFRGYFHETAKSIDGCFDVGYDLSLENS